MSSELPLFAWASVLRARLAKRRRLQRRAVWLAGLGAALALTVAFPPRPVLVWNASESAPVGLYAVGDTGELRRGDMVIAWLPDHHRRFAAERHYLPRNVPLVKRIAAMSGDRVCAIGHTLTVNGGVVAERRADDRQDRPLPWWRGCMVLGEGELLLLMDHPGSFDGRYVGPIARTLVVGEARPLWTR